MSYQMEVPEWASHGFDRAMRETEVPDDVRERLWDLTISGIDQNPPPWGLSEDELEDAVAESIHTLAHAFIEDRESFDRHLMAEEDFGWICRRWPNLWPFCVPPPAPASGSELGMAPMNG